MRLHPLRVCAVIPAHNEARAIERVVRGALEHVGQVFVVDDGSSDNTARLALRAGAGLIVHARRHGKGAALTRGLDAAFQQGFEAAVLLDGDGQHLPREIPRLLDAARGGADLVLGDRSHGPGSMPLLRRLTNQWLTRVLRPLVGEEIRDSQCGFRWISARLWSSLRVRSAHFEIESEMLLEARRSGARIAQVPVSAVYAGERSKIRVIPDAARFAAFLFRASLLESARPAPEIRRQLERLSAGAAP